MSGDDLLAERYRGHPAGVRLPGLPRPHAQGDAASSCSTLRAPASTSTEHFAMTPAASVSRSVLRAPGGPVLQRRTAGRDQVEDYAARCGWIGARPRPGCARTSRTSPPDRRASGVLAGRGCYRGRARGYLLALLRRHGRRRVRRRARHRPGRGRARLGRAGRRYPRRTAALWYCNVGYGREEIAEAAHRRDGAPVGVLDLGDQSNRPAIELAERGIAATRRSRLEGLPDERRFGLDRHGNQDGPALLAAARRARANGARDPPARVPRMHVAGTSLAGIEANARGPRPAGRRRREDRLGLPAARSRRDRVRRSRAGGRLLLRAGDRRRGVFAPPEGYTAEVRAICRETGVLFVADEVITGFGRVGDWFASSRWDLEPDIVTCAKGITQRLPPDGRGDRSPVGGRTLLAARRRPVAARLHYSGSRDGGGGRAREPRRDGARGAARAGARARTGPRNHRWLRWPSTRSSARSAPAPGCCGDPVLPPRRSRPMPVSPARVVKACRANGILTRALGIGALQVSPGADPHAGRSSDELVDGGAEPRSTRPVRGNWVAPCRPD